MSVTSAKSPNRYQVLRIYDGPTTRRLWFAFEKAWDDFPGGRTPFAARIAALVLEPPYDEFRYSDGHVYEPGEAPAPETVRNFLRAGKAFRIGSPDPTPRFKDDTLRFFHAFLWRAMPDIAETIGNPQDSHVRFLARSFGAQPPHLYFPDAIRLVIPKTRRYGVVIFADNGNPNSSNCCYFDCGDPYVTDPSAPRHPGQRRYPPDFRKGRAVLIKQSGFSHSDRWGVSIVSREHIISIELAETATDERAYVSIYVPDFFLIEDALEDPVGTSLVPARVESATYRGDVQIDRSMPDETADLRKLCSLSL